MAGPIYKAFRVSFKEAWYKLSKQEQDATIAKVNDALEKVGGKAVMPLCDSSWSSEEWQFFGVEMYPDLEAVQKHTELLNAFGWFRYIRSSTQLGTATTV